MAKRILCIGAFAMDTIYRMERLPDGPGKFLPIDAMEIAEGMATSAACSIARLGGDVALWASVGQDDVGARMIASIAAEGVDCSLIRRIANAPSAVSAVFVDRAGERTIVPYYATALMAEPVVPPEVGQGAFSVVMADVRWPEAAASALSAARQAGCHAVLDADVGPKNVLQQLARLASHIIASDGGAAALTGEAEPQSAAVMLARQYAGEVVVTAGRQGCYWFDREQNVVRQVGAPKVDVVDTTAAGDVFHGAYCLGLAEGRRGIELLQFANAAAAIKCTRFGGRLGAPTRAETEALMVATYG